MTLLKKLKDIYVLLTNKDAYVAMQAGCTILIAAMRNEEKSGTISVTKKDGSIVIVDYAVKPRKG